MKREENHCNYCDLPCIDCGRKRVEVYYCDECGEEIEGDRYESDGDDLCESCLLERHRKED